MYNKLELTVPIMRRVIQKNYELEKLLYNRNYNDAVEKDITLKIAINSPWSLLTNSQ